MKQGWRLFCPPTTENMTYDIALENIQRALTRTLHARSLLCGRSAKLCCQVILQSLVVVFNPLLTLSSPIWSPSCHLRAGQEYHEKTTGCGCSLGVEAKKKEENKCQVETQLKEWINRMTIDHLLLSDDMTKVTEIDSQPVDNYNMVYLRALCIKFKVNGYKNKRRDEMLQLLCCKKRIWLVESVQHDPESTTTPARISATSASADDNNHDKYDDEDHESNNVEENHDKQQSANSNISSDSTY